VARVLALLLCLTAVAAASAPRILDKPIIFNDERKALTLDYLHLHYGSTASSIEIVPRMIVIHWTAAPTLASSFAALNPVRLPGARADIARASALNVSAHFLVDRDGTIYRLMPETWMARHVIGLNYCALGIENVGGGVQHPLTAAQLQADAALVRYLKGRYNGIEYLIGHHEYGRFRGTPLWRERDPSYFTAKIDPGDEFMRRLREEVGDLGLKGVPG
jgi:N-acetylmuramoyl-L-alanine amidase